MRDDLSEREGSGFDIVTTFDDLEVWSDGSQVFVGLLVCEIT